MRFQKRQLKSKKNKNFLVTIILIALMILMVGCQGDEASPTPGLYKPPTLAPTNSPIPPRIPSATSVSSTCKDYLSFVEDVTIPDGTIVSPGEILVKRWRIENTGECNWAAGYFLQLISGPDLGAPPNQALYPARRDAEIVLQISFTTPEEPGHYTSMWQAYNPQGMPFGEAFYIEVVVEGEE